MKYVYVVTASPDNKEVKHSEPYETEKAAHDAGKLWIEHNVPRDGSCWYLDTHPVSKYLEEEQ